MFAEILAKAPPEIRKKHGKDANSVCISELEAKMRRTRKQIYNDTKGALIGFDCPICNNKGTVCEIVNDEEVLLECICMRTRRSMQRMIQSGLTDMLQEYTFDKYKAEEGWQKKIKESAIRYAENPEGWFFIGGTVGSGKTHICTAICDKLLEQEVPVKYMLWRDEIVRLKAIVNEPEYPREINKYKEAPCLYIDDFLKSGDGKATVGDINAAFQILNYRYNRKDLYTIISSEKTMEAIIAADEAIGSRIYQRTKEHCFSITGKDKNYRMR